jgi:hypothetical protein
METNDNQQLADKVATLTAAVDLPLNCHPAALRAWSVSVTP